MPWSIKLTYRSRRPEKTKQTIEHVQPDLGLGLAVSLSDVQLQEGESTELRVSVANRELGKGRAMTVAVVGVPAGLQVKPSQLQALVAMGKLGAWELRGRELLLYWRGIEAGGTRQVLVQVQASGMGEFHGPISRAYVYYDEEIRDYADSLRVLILPPGPSSRP